MAIIAVAPTIEPELRSMPPEMITWVTPRAMMPMIETCRMMIDSRAVLKIEVAFSRVLNRNEFAHQQPAERLEDRDDQHECEEDVQFGRAVPFRGIEGQPADAMRCLRHVRISPATISR